MSGLAGFTGNVDNRVIDLMTERIKHRGPGYNNKYEDGFISLGFCGFKRQGNNFYEQPVFNEDKSLLLILDGIIYNHNDLKKDLTNSGHVFYSESDAEVLVHLYEEHKFNMFKFIRGVFAFVIYEINNGLVFAARDFFGAKPFYYTEINNEIIFASEIKSILEYPDFKKEINVSALENYLSFQYSVLNETFFSGVYKLPAGHYMVYKNKKIDINKYFHITFNPNKNLSMDDAAQLIGDAVRDSVKMHINNCDSVGSFLSSGVDSSYITACSGCGDSFTVGFDDEGYNEIIYASSLAKNIGIKNHSKTISADEYWGILPKVMYHMDEPLADPAAVALYFASELASLHVDVSLSGEAADEFFGGYNIYKEPISLQIFSIIPFIIKNMLGIAATALPFSFKGKNFIIRGCKRVEERFIGNAYIFTKKERERILKNPVGADEPTIITKPYYEMAKEYDDITKMQFIDIHLWMPGDILLKADKTSMAHSLEVRMPLLDIEIFKIASILPEKFKITKMGTKLAFRKAASVYLSKDSAEKKKLGFPVPLRNWLKDEKYYNKVKAAFTNKAAEKYFNVSGLLSLLNIHYSGKKDVSRKIWVIYIFLVWYEVYFCE